LGVIILRPEVLDHFGLIPAMKWQIQQSQIRKKTEYESNFGIKNYSFSKYESTTLFRIFQEIISNISRHSDATKVYISFKEENDQIILEVKDNGIGFEMNKLEQIDSFGLIGMRERALSIGAELTIESLLTMGTTVTLLLKKKQNESKNQGDD